MTESINAGNFVGYEYRDITINRDLESLYADGYQSFGWILEKAVAPGSPVGLNHITLKFKRDRKIRNKMELTRLQRQFDACVVALEGMERSKTAAASIAAYSIGLAGTAFMAGSVFAIVATPPIIPLCIVLAVPAFAGWILPYFLYKSRYAKKAEALAPLIDSKYDEIYEVCERATSLLGN